MWKDILLDNNEHALKLMVKYCKKDVELLQRIYDKLAGYGIPKTHAGVADGLERWTCPHCGSEEVRLDKTKPTARGILQRQMRCQSCYRYYTICDKVYKDHLVAKDGE